MPNFLASISLLFPAFAVAGLALASIPVIIHILNRRRYRTVEWAAMDFLLRAMRKNRRRVRFEQWLLLATRCTLLALLGLALARPLGCDANSSAAFGGRTGLHVFILDNSYSMDYRSNRPGAKTHFEQAKSIITAVIDKLNSGGESVVLITAGKPAASPLPKPTYDLQQARAIVGRVKQSYTATDLSAAFQMAIDIGRDNQKQPNKNLYILTDATASAWQSDDAAVLKEQGPQLASLYHVQNFNLARGQQWNQAVVNVHPSTNLMTTQSHFGADFFAVVRGYGLPHEATLQWKVDGKLMSGGGGIKPDTATQPQIEPLPLLESAIKTGGPHVITAGIVGDDPLQIDNTRSRVINVLSQLKVLIVEGQPGPGQEGGTGLNLQVALAGLNATGQAQGFAAPDLISDLELSTRVLTDYRAVILCGVAQVTPAEADQLQAFAQAGGTVMVFVGPNISAESYNTVMLPRHLIPGPLTKAMTPPEGKSFYFDFNPNGTLHPLLKAFAQQTDTGLERAQIYGYWQCDIPADPQLRVLNFLPAEGARINPGQLPDPAITEQAIGQGRAVFVATSANEEWITFTRKPIYTELMNELLSGSVNAGDAWMNLSVGDRLQVPGSVKMTTTPTLTDPHSLPISLDLSAPANGPAVYTSPALNEPGLYALNTGGGSLPIAVNLPAAEADVRTLDNAAIKSALGGIDMVLGDDSPPTATALASMASDWGWSVMLIVLALVGFESFLAMRFGHFRSR